MTLTHSLCRRLAPPSDLQTSVGGVARAPPTRPPRRRGTPARAWPPPTATPAAPPCPLLPPRPLPATRAKPPACPSTACPTRRQSHPSHANTPPAPRSAGRSAPPLSGSAMTAATAAAAAAASPATHSPAPAPPRSAPPTPPPPPPSPARPLGIRRLWRGPLHHLHLCGAGHGRGARAARPRPGTNLGRRDWRRRHHRRHGLRGDEQRRLPQLADRRHLQRQWPGLAADGHPFCRRHRAGWLALGVHVSPDRLEAVPRLPRHRKVDQPALPVRDPAGQRKDRRVRARHGVGRHALRGARLRLHRPRAL